MHFKVKRYHEERVHLLHEAGLPAAVQSHLLDLLHLSLKVCDHLVFANPVGSTDNHTFTWRPPDNSQSAHCTRLIHLDANPMCSIWLGNVSSSASMSSACCGWKTRYTAFFNTVSSEHLSVPGTRPHLGYIVHEVHARLVCLGVGQLEQGRHPEADGVGTVTTLKKNM